jgi:hypothetical protein
MASPFSIRPLTLILGGAPESGFLEKSVAQDFNGVPRRSLAR